MAGHSQFKNIMHRKGAQDKKRAKIFTRLTKEIIVAARSGLPDPAANPRLRAAIQSAKAENMPKDRIETAIKRGSGDADGDYYEEVRYEGYGQAGVAIIVEALSDNRNRTASEVRATFSKYGGNLGETGSVGFMFDRLGEIRYPLAVVSEEAMLESAIEAGAEDVTCEEESHRITTAMASLHEVAAALESQYGEPQSTKLIWQPQTLAPVPEDKLEGLMKLIDMLDDLDDVQEVTSNMALDEAALARLQAS